MLRNLSISERRTKNQKTKGMQKDKQKLSFNVHPNKITSWWRICTALGSVSVCIYMLYEIYTHDSTENSAAVVICILYLIAGIASIILANHGQNIATAILFAIFAVITICTILIYNTVSVQFFISAIWASIAMIITSLTTTWG